MYAKDGRRLHSIPPLSTTTGGKIDLNLTFERNPLNIIGCLVDNLEVFYDTNQSGQIVV